MIQSASICHSKDLAYCYVQNQPENVGGEKKSKPVLLCYTAGNSEFTKYFQRKPSYSTSSHKAIWKNPCPTEERCLSCPCQLSEYMNSVPLDFQTLVMMLGRHQQCTAGDSRGFAAPCAVPGDPGCQAAAAAAEPRSHGSEQLREGFSATPLPMQDICTYTNILQHFVCHGCSSTKNFETKAPTLHAVASK